MCHSGRNFNSTQFHVRTHTHTETKQISTSLINSLIINYKDMHEISRYMSVSVLEKKKKCTRVM